MPNWCKSLDILDEPNDEPLFLVMNRGSAHSPYIEGPGEWVADPQDWLSTEGAHAWLRPYLIPESKVPGQTKRRGVHVSWPTGSTGTCDALAAPRVREPQPATTTGTRSTPHTKQAD
jgi:hypothetical protein